MASTASRRFYIAGPVTLAALTKIMAEARDAGVPSPATAQLTIYDEGTMLAAFLHMSGVTQSYIEFTWGME